MKTVFDSITTLLFESLREDLRDNSSATKQLIAVEVVLMGIALVAALFLPWWRPRPLSPWAVVLFGGGVLGILGFVFRYFRRDGEISG